jgi:hypothetical protein
MLLIVSMTNEYSFEFSRACRRAALGNELACDFSCWINEEVDRIPMMISNTESAGNSNKHTGNPVFSSRKLASDSTLSIRHSLSYAH